MVEPAPSITTLSRVFKRIVQQGLAEKLCIDLVSQCKEAGIIDGQHLPSIVQRLMPTRRRNRTHKTKTQAIPCVDLTTRLSGVDTLSELLIALAVASQCIWR